MQLCRFMNGTFSRRTTGARSTATLPESTAAGEGIKSSEKLINQKRSQTYHHFSFHLHISIKLRVHIRYMTGTCEESTTPQEKDVDLLNQFEAILDSDPLIDEVGFVHPSQFTCLSQILDKSSDLASKHFWVADHKLGVSTEVLLRLYKVAKDAFMSSYRPYNSKDESLLGSSSFHSLQREVMRHSKALLLLSSDFITAWNSRKLILSDEEQLSLFMEELLLSELVLSVSPKSEQAWSHRRWVIKKISGKCSTLRDVLAKESELVEKLCERSKMNYRAWNHRCWLASYMSRDQVLFELVINKDWAGLHVADNSCFHYRRRLIQRITDRSCNMKQNESSYDTENLRILKEELDWNEVLIKRYIGREALWIHRRFLSSCWVSHLTNRSYYERSSGSEHKISMDNEITKFVDNELCLLNSCSVIHDSEFEDYQSQAMCSATYMLWLKKQVYDPLEVEVGAKINAACLKTVLDKTCPERSFLCDCTPEK